MVVKRGEGDFTQIYRPCKISEVVGNAEAKRIIKKAFEGNEIPHNFLFHGLSGTGKTTLARIIEMGLNCEKGPTSEPCCECAYCQRIINRKGSLAVKEINAVEILKDDLKQMLSEFDAYGFGLLGGHKKSVLLIDECHGLTDDQAGLFLKHTEDVHKDNYFIFCTTDPDKFLDTLRNRCTIKLPFEKLGDEEILKLLSGICQQEALNCDTETLAGIVKESEGMARVAVSRLQQAYLAGKLTKKRILTLKGKNNVIAIAPHAPKDDDYTNIITKTMYDELGCYAVINEKYSRKDVNLNKIKKIQDKGIESEFLGPIKNFKDSVAANGLNPLIVLVHGMEDSNMDTWGGKNVKILIGYGQGEPGDETKPHRPTLDKSDLNKLEASIKSAKLSSKPAPLDSDYCARDKNNLNQLFNLESHKNYHDPKVRSVQLEIRKSGLRGNEQEANETGKRLSEALKAIIQKQSAKLEEPLDDQKSVIAEIKKVSVADIQFDGKDDQNYNFRIYNTDDSKLDGQHEKERNELADSIKKNGLVHPIVLLQKSDGKFKILCGFRRFGALKKLGANEVEAKVYQEKDLTENQRLHISLAENAKRRDLNRVEIAAFLDAARRNGNSKRTLGKLGEEFGESLGIGTSPGSIYKYIKLNEIRVKEESPEIIKDVLKGKLQFGIASEVLAFIDNSKDRNALYEEIVKRLKPTRPGLKEIRKLLRAMDGSLETVLNNKKVKSAIKKAESAESKGKKLIELLKIQMEDPLTKQKKQFDGQVRAIRKKVFNGNGNADNFKVIPPADFEKNEITVQFKLSDENYNDVAKNIKPLLNKNGELRKLLGSIVDTKRTDSSKHFKAWPKKRIKLDNNVEKLAELPVILSTGRNTDIPAFHSNWFLNSLEKGYAVKINKSGNKEYLSFDNTRLIVFWTKNPGPIIDRLPEIDKLGINYYFLYTLNDYEEEKVFEPGIPPLKERIEVFKRLSKKIGKKKVIWRFDPLIMTDKISIELLIDKISGVSRDLGKYTEKLVFSFVKIGQYKHVKERFKKIGINYRKFNKDDANFIAEKLGSMGKRLGIKVATCAERFDFSEFDITPNKCIDDELIREVFSNDVKLMKFIGDGKGLKDPIQRKLCNCVASKDIGFSGTCKINCAYCYATESEEKIKSNFERISDTDESLIPI